MNPRGLRLALSHGPHTPTAHRQRDSTEAAPAPQGHSPPGPAVGHPEAKGQASRINGKKSYGTVKLRVGPGLVAPSKLRGVTPEHRSTGDTRAATFTASVTDK